MTRAAQPVQQPINGAGVAHDTVIVLVTQAAALGGTLALQSALAWRLGPEGRGAYAIVLFWSSLLAVLFGLAVDRATQQQVISLRVNAAEGLWAGTVLTVIGSTAACLAAAAIAVTSTRWPAQLGVSLSVWLPLIPSTSLWTFVQLQYAGLGRFRDLGRLTVMQLAATLALTLMLTSPSCCGASGAAVSLVAGQSIAAAIGLNGLRNRMAGVEWLPSWDTCRSILSFGARYYGARVGTVIDLQLGVGLLALVATREHVGFFAASSALAMKLMVLPDSIEAALVPRMSGHTPNLTAVCQVARIVSGAMAAGTALMCIAAYPLVIVVLSPQFAAAVPVILILAPSIFLYSIAKMPTAYLRAIDRPGLASLAMWAGLTVNIALFLPLYQSAGYLAAAWAMTAGFIVRAVVVLTGFVVVTRSQVWDIVLPSGGDLARVRALLEQTVRNHILPKPCGASE